MAVLDCVDACLSCFALEAMFELALCAFLPVSGPFLAFSPFIQRLPI